MGGSDWRNTASQSQRRYIVSYDSRVTGKNATTSAAGSHPIALGEDDNHIQITQV